MTAKRTQGRWDPAVQYEPLLNTVNDAVFLHDLSGRLLEVNAVTCVRLGYSRDELLARTVLDIAPGASRDAIRVRIEEIFRKGSMVFETVHVARDGREVPTEVSSRVIEYGSRPAVLNVGRDLTERREAERALRESESMLRTVFQAAPIGMGLIKDRILGWVNERMSAITGYTTKELMGMAARQLYETQEEYDRVGRVKYAQIAERGTGSVEARMVRKDGRAIDVLLRSTAVDPNDLSAGLVFTITDITERKRVEEALRLTQFSVDHAADPAFWIAPDAKVVYVNDAACRELGYSRDELLRMKVYDFDTQFTEEVWPAHWKELKRHGSLTFESRHRRRDGRVFDVEVTVNYLEFNGWEYNFASARDITDRKEAEQRKSASERRYRELYESSRDGYAMVGMDGRIIESNSAFRDLLGYTEDELRTKTYVDITPRRWHEAEEKVLREQVFARGYSDVYEKEYRRKDGKAIPIEIRTYLLRGADGEPAGMWGFIREVSERKQLEEQFLQAQKMEAVGRLAGGIAHDFNNQLTVIKGYCDLLLAEPADESGSRLELQEIRAAADRAQKLTAQLLAFSRKQVLKPTVTNLNEVLREMHNPLARMIGEDVRLAVVTDPNLGNVRVDRSQVQQALMNMVVNARDAMPAGGRLMIETANVSLDDAYAQRHAGASAGPHVMLAVSDTGRGMDGVTMERIFEPFFTTKEAGKGTGLGLSMVYGFVRQSGGTVYVYGEPGRGATFKVYLPRVFEPDEAPKPGSAVDETPGGDETILVAEDDQSVRQLIVRTLRERGYTVLEASGPEEAIRLSTDHAGAIGLLITDVIMPAMNGPDLAERLHARRAATRVLYVSGYAENAVVHHGLLDEGVQLLSKPFQAAGLAQMVRQILDQGRPVPKEEA